MIDRKYVGAVVAVAAVAGAGMMAFTTKNVSAAEAHRTAISTPVVEGMQVAQDAAAGATAFVRCRVCHTVERGEPNRVGPNLFGVFGRKAGEVAGFNYSAPMKSSNITWTEENLERYIKDPAGVVPGNKMQLAKGAINDKGADDIVAFLKTKM